VAIRSVAIPLLSGGALLVGYAAFSWLQSKRAKQLVSAPRTLREVGLTEPMAQHSAEASAGMCDETTPNSERSPELAELLELDLELDFEELPQEHAASRHDSVAPEDIGALFLARATDALSPFGGGFEHERLELDPFDLERSMVSEATSRASNGGTDFEARDDGEDPEAAPESERRPSSARVGARS
jgi:hypothetical protein